MNFCNLRTILQVRVACFTFNRRNASRTEREREVERREKEGQARKGCRQARDTKSIRVICPARTVCSESGRLYSSKVRVYLACEIARNRLAEENIYCAVLSSHGKSEQRRARESEFFTPPDVTRRPDGVPLFFDFLRRFPPRPPLFSLSLSRSFVRRFFPATMPPSASLLVLLLFLLPPDGGNPDSMDARYIVRQERQGPMD